MVRRCLQAAQCPARVRATRKEDLGRNPGVGSDVNKHAQSPERPNAVRVETGARITRAVRRARRCEYGIVKNERHGDQREPIQGE